MENLCSVKDHINKVRRKAIDREKIFANWIYNKGLISWICKELSNSTVRKETMQTENGQKKWTVISPKIINEWQAHGNIVNAISD